MEIETIAIIGAGGLGQRFACLSLRAGYRTILEDVSMTALERAVTAIREVLTAGAVQLAAREMDINFGAKLATAHSVEDAVREADLIIETVADELEMKLELFTVFDKFARPGAVLASTTHSIRIGDLAEMTVCPEHCIGMRLASHSANELGTRMDRQQTITGHGEGRQLSDRPSASEQRANHVEFFERPTSNPNACERLGAQYSGSERLQLVKSRSTSQQTLECCIGVAHRMHLTVEVIDEG
jgi:hypothetical protein